MSSQSSPRSIHTQGAQDQVILPNHIAFRICMRGIRARLGRSGVTLLGVCFGIAFLMSVISGFHVKNAMRKDVERTLVVERYVKALIAEIGVLEGKTLVVVLGAGTDADREFVRTLRTEESADVKLIAAGGQRLEGVDANGSAADVPAAAAVMGVGAWAAALSPELTAALQGRKFVVFEEPSAETRTRLEDAGARVQALGIELRGDEVQSQARKAREQETRTLLIVSISLLITVIGIANAMLMSVTERFREIGTMKCLGGLSSFVVKLFLIECSIVGFVGSLLGAVIGAIFPLIGYSYKYGLASLFSAVVMDSASMVTMLTYGGLCVVAGVVLSIIAGIYPARVASKMIPAVALSSHV